MDYRESAISFDPEIPLKNAAVNEAIEHAHEYVIFKDNDALILNSQGREVIKEVSQAEQGNIESILGNFGRLSAWYEYGQPLQSDSHPALAEKLTAAENKVADELATQVYLDLKVEVTAFLKQHNADDNTIAALAEVTNIQRTEENSEYFDALVVYQAALEIYEGNLDVKDGQLINTRIRREQIKAKRLAATNNQERYPAMYSPGSRRNVLVIIPALGLLAACSKHAELTGSKSETLPAPVENKTPEPTNAPINSESPTRPATATTSPTETGNPPSEQVPSQEAESIEWTNMFGNIELGPYDGSPGKPTFLFIQTENNQYKIFFRPKQYVDADQGNDYYDYHLPYNIDITDGTLANIQTVHSGSSNTLGLNKKKWPAEDFVVAMREQKGSTEVALKTLVKNAKTVVLVQGDFPDGKGIDDYTNPQEVEEKTKQIGMFGEGLQNPVIQEAELKLAHRFSPEITQHMEDTFVSLDTKLNDYIPPEQQVEMQAGDMYLMMCDQVDPDDPNDGTNNHGTRNSQARIVLALSPKKFSQ